MGFEETIVRLKRSFSHNPTPRNNTINLAGVACGGKSQVAIEFCHRARMDHQFGAIFWIKASSTASIKKVFKSIADRFNIPKSEPPEARLKTSMAVLTAWPCPWLLVFDNYNGDTVEQDLRPYMPNGEQGSFLITRKCSDAESGIKAGRATTVYLPNLRLQDTVDLLLKRSAVGYTDENYEQGVKLAIALEKVPRAIMQAGTFIKKYKVPIVDYLKMFQEGDERTAARFFNELRIRRLNDAGAAT
jgi:hypothetical protein